VGSLAAPGERLVENVRSARGWSAGARVGSGDVGGVCAHTPPGSQAAAVQTTIRTIRFVLSFIGQSRRSRAVTHMGRSSIGTNSGNRMQDQPSIVPETISPEPERLFVGRETWRQRSRWLKRCKPKASAKARLGPARAESGEWVQAALRDATIGPSGGHPWIKTPWRPSWPRCARSTCQCLVREKGERKVLDGRLGPLLDRAQATMIEPNAR
jgi:hypothetical protein